MRHPIVSRVAAAFVALFLVCAGLFAWQKAGARTGRPGKSVTAVAPAAPTAPASGAALFDRSCASCHAADAIARTLRTGADRAGRLRDLDGFLQHHGEAAPDEDRLILDYLFAREP